MRPTLLYSLVGLLFSPCNCLSTDPEIRDLNGHFTLNFHYYEKHFQNSFCILIVEPIYTIFLLYHVTSRDVRNAGADRDLQNMWDPRKHCGSFVDEKLRVLHRRNLNK